MVYKTSTYKVEGFTVTVEGARKWGAPVGTYLVEVFGNPKKGGFGIAQRAFFRHKKRAGLNGFYVFKKSTSVNGYHAWHVKRR